MIEPEEGTEPIETIVSRCWARALEDDRDRERARQSDVCEVLDDEAAGALIVGSVGWWSVLREAPHQAQEPELAASLRSTLEDLVS